MQTTSSAADAESRLCGNNFGKGRLNLTMIQRQALNREMDNDNLMLWLMLILAAFFTVVLTILLTEGVN